MTTMQKLTDISLDVRHKCETETNIPSVLTTASITSTTSSSVSDTSIACTGLDGAPEAQELLPGFISLAGEFIGAGILQAAVPER